MEAALKADNMATTRAQHVDANAFSPRFLRFDTLMVVESISAILAKAITCIATPQTPADMAEDNVSENLQYALQGAALKGDTTIPTPGKLGSRNAPSSRPMAS